ncbi:MAG: hypothetical protein NC201_06340, partial [Prevotella sp.]|nr:hypothetical protein [Prevotella sp.]
KEWVEDLAKTYRNADKIKSEMIKLCDMSHWQEWANEYGLPVSLIGYIFKHTADCGMFMHERVEPFLIFLLTHYSKRKERIAKQREEEAKLDQFKAVMRWKLGLGNFNKLLEGDSPIPSKSKVATHESWEVEPMPEGDDISHCDVKISVPQSVMEIIRRGHIPEVQEDHWFMYADDTHIRYYRSWTGMCAFEAHYRKIRSGNYVIDSLTINKALVEFGVNGDMAGVALFRYLLTADAGGDAEGAWNEYLRQWTILHNKYSKKSKVLRKIKKS